MKTFFITLLMLPLLTFAQQSSLAKMANFTDADSNRAHVTVSGKAFSLMAKMEIDSVIDDQVKRLANSITGMEAYMELSSATATKMLGSLANNKAFDEYASFDRKDEKVKFYVNETDGVVSEMIVVMVSKDAGYASAVTGSMDIRDVGKLYKLVQERSYQYLKEKDAK